MVDILEISNDLSAEAKGVWRTYRGGRFRIARFSDDIARWIEQQERERSRPNMTSDEAAALRVELGKESIARFVLTDWDDLTDKGEPLPFSRDLALVWAREPAYQSLFQFITNVSMNGENYRRRLEAEDLGK